MGDAEKVLVTHGIVMKHADDYFAVFLLNLKNNSLHEKRNTGLIF